MIKLVFSADNVKEVADAAEAEKALKKAKAVALGANGEIKGLDFVNEAPEGAELQVYAFDSKEGREVYRHSVSHVMAHAVKELFPEAKLAIGPATEDGFYYDFDLENPLVPEDLGKIEKKMFEIIKKNEPFVRSEVPRAEAIEIFTNSGEAYKVEVLGEIEDETVSLYSEGDFTDLCRGPHLLSAGRVSPAFRLLSIAGAYWRGDEKNRMLQRIYGTAFRDKKDLADYLHFLEEVKKRDHRKLGKELDLFSVSEDIGPGLILWHPRGASIRNTIEEFWKAEHQKAGYALLFSPHIAKLQLWQKSGHLDFYSENMYSPMEIDQIKYELKPMNCPFHIQIYKSALRSYRELPIRYAELGTVYRYERSGVLHGLLRVRGFTQDDAHIFCTEEQLDDEVSKILDFTLFILRTFGFEDFDVYLSTRPDKFVGSEDNWEKSTVALKKALDSSGLRYEIDPGEGVFYGPKIDIKVKDSLGRPWQCSTIQVDFNLPERFDIEYRGADGAGHIPIMIHRALMGSLERFFGILIEHFAGAFPLWLSPEQVTVLTIAERHSEFALGVADELRAAGIRAVSDLNNEKIGHKIRQATIRKIPYLVIIGDAEVSARTLALRKRTGEQSGPYTSEELIGMLKEEIRHRR